MDQALEEIKILDLSRVLAGPYAQCFSNRVFLMDIT
ncbi:hypothetical protein SAMN05446037_102350 [Anaerovirgula multivorans]|uniref:Uncharacterized protein n=1 Tax=Anaerovirgula multivorans TaxID=312168 RepID=A0A239HRI8_9FIRM|nr:CoA transferase [Anaerovirgula multivorans]SNS83939.1 hypothetical protein SAMN05446037_102350 [Anaerovirgula multivorans]